MSSSNYSITNEIYIRATSPSVLIFLSKFLNRSQEITISEAPQHRPLLLEQIHP